MHFVYIVRCADGTLYTGYARDPVMRERAHNSGRGAKYTSSRRPVQLVYKEAFRSLGKALAREYVVKQLTRAQKEALVAEGERRQEKVRAGWGKSLAAPTVRGAAGTGNRARRRG